MYVNFGGALNLPLSTSVKSELIETSGQALVNVGDAYSYYNFVYPFYRPFPYV